MNDSTSPLCFNNEEHWWGVQLQAKIKCVLFQAGPEENTEPLPGRSHGQATLLTSRLMQARTQNSLKGTDVKNSGPSGWLCCHSCLHSSLGTCVPWTLLGTSAKSPPRTRVLETFSSTLTHTQHFSTPHLSLFPSLCRWVNEISAVFGLGLL